MEEWKGGRESLTWSQHSMTKQALLHWQNTTPRNYLDSHNTAWRNNHCFTDKTVHPLTLWTQSQHSMKKQPLLHWQNSTPPNSGDTVTTQHEETSTGEAGETELDSHNTAWRNKQGRESWTVTTQHEETSRGDSWTVTTQHEETSRGERVGQSQHSMKKQAGERELDSHNTAWRNKHERESRGRGNTKVKQWTWKGRGMR